MRHFYRICAVVATFAAAGAAEITHLPAPPAAVQPPSVTDAEQRAATKKIVTKKVILVGDSTMQVGSGWGGAFCAHHLSSFVACVNLGRGGRSTFSYRAEGSWDIALAEMKAPGYSKVYVLIQLGHNDQPGKPGRSTDLYKEFPANLAQYVKETREAGAIPVLVTPLTRRSFKDGSLQDDLQPWADAARKVAKEMNVPLVDLHAVSTAAVQKMGPVEATKLAEMLPPQYVLDAAAKGTTISATPAESRAATPDLKSTEVVETPQGRPNIVFDYTHIGDTGADVFSAEVAAELARVVPDLRRELYP